MADYLEKKEVKKALDEAKKLEKEKEPIPTRKDEAELVKETVSLSEKLKWFVKDVDAHTPCTQCRKRKPVKKAIRTKHAGKKKK
jgi:hypothetical protein